jgi:hypothetical protein
MCVFLKNGMELAGARSLLRTHDTLLGDKQSSIVERSAMRLPRISVWLREA